jgi:hypothetical protein
MCFSVDSVFIDLSTTPHMRIHRGILLMHAFMRFDIILDCCWRVRIE